jgi:hypothetical protein
MMESDGLTVRVYREIAIYSYCTYYMYYIHGPGIGNARPGMPACDALVEET